MSSFKLSTNASVVLVVVIGVVCAAYLAISESPLAGTVIPVIVTLVGGAVVQLLKQQATDAKVDTSIAQSRENTNALATIAPQVKQAVVQATQAATQVSAVVDAVAENTATTDSTHNLVNGQAKAAATAAEESARHRVELAEQKAEIAALVELARTTLAELAARDQGIKEGRAQMGDASRP